MLRIDNSRFCNSFRSNQVKVEFTLVGKRRVNIFFLNNMNLIVKYAIYECQSKKIIALENIDLFGYYFSFQFFPVLHSF